MTPNDIAKHRFPNKELDCMVTKHDIAAAANTILQGGLVAYPTETVYGLGANALDPTAVARIFELKGRPRFDPLIVHIASMEGLPPLVQHVPEAAMALIKRFWPGPLSIVLPKKSCVPDNVTSGLPSVAVQFPRHTLRPHHSS
jgi:L-threonylcarbamoyladenylate synthase